MTSLVILFTCFIFLLNTSNHNVKGENVTTGAISIVFDDNYGNQLTNAWTLMEERGFIGTFYVLTSTVNTPGYMSYAALQTLQAGGNEIASHSVNHNSFTNLTDQQIRNECTNSKTILEEYNLVIKNIAYPNGVTDSRVDSIVDDYYDSGRTAYISPYFVELPNTQFRLPGFSEEDQGTEIDLLKNMIDQVSSTNSWSIFLFHNILPGDHSSPYTTSQEDFEDFLDYVLLKELPTITISQGLDAITLTMDTNIGTSSPLSGDYTLGSEVVIEAFVPVAGVGERFVWEGWSGSGVGSYSGDDNPATITLSSSITQNAHWRHEYSLKINSNYGEIVPFVGEKWYEVDSEVVIEAFVPVAGVGERFVWEGWSGSGVGSYSGDDNPATITMDEPITVTASWKNQFNILIHYDDLGSDISKNPINVNGISYRNEVSLWLDRGSILSFSFEPELLANQDKKYVWASSSGLSNQKSGSIIISGSGAITGKYNVQYFVAVISNYSDTLGSGWYFSGDIVNPTLSNINITESQNERYVFSGWLEDGNTISGASDLFIVNNSISLTAFWQKQYLIEFNQQGLPDEFGTFLVVNSENQSLPFLIWIDKGDTVDFNYPNNIQNGFGTQYILTLPLNQSTVISESPTIITATYYLQYTMDLFIMIALAAIIGSLVFVIIFLRRRNLI